MRDYIELQTMTNAEWKYAALDIYGADIKRTGFIPTEAEVCSRGYRHMNTKGPHVQLARNVAVDDRRYALC